MGAPYSEDLRLRVLAALDGGMSKMAAHKFFGISRSTLDDWLHLREQHGSLAAKTDYHRGLRPKITDSDLEGLLNFAQARENWTLLKLAQEWHQETGQLVSRVTLRKALARAGWTRKKRAGATENATPMSELSSSPN